MCGRLSDNLTWSQICDLYSLKLTILEGIRLPLFNVAPTQALPVVVAADGTRTLQAMRWGFPSMWLPEPWAGRPLINAVAEEAAKKPTWSKALRERRCLVPTSGFYEWQKVGKKRYPLWFRPAHGEVLTLAGLWGEFEKEGERIRCVSILTVANNADLEGVHDRMPVILPEGDWATWLDPKTPAAAVQALLQPAPNGTLAASEVSTDLNRWQASGPGVLTADWSRAALPAP